MRKPVPPLPGEQPVQHAASWQVRGGRPPAAGEGGARGQRGRGARLLGRGPVKTRGHLLGGLEVVLARGVLTAHEAKLAGPTWPGPTSR